MEHFINFLGKFSKYEILNNLIPGVALSFILWKCGYPVWGADWVINIIVSYYIGMVCSRFSSLCIEEPFKKWEWIKWREYEEYNKAKKERSFIVILQTNANMYRCFAGVFVLAFVAVIYSFIRPLCSWLSVVEVPALILLLALLYIFSYRKQINDYVVKNIDEVNGRQQNEN